MRRSTLPALAGAALLLGLPAAAEAEQQVELHVGAWRGNGRIGLHGRDGKPPQVRIAQDGTRVTLQFVAPTRLSLRAGLPPPQNVVAMAPVAGGLSITLSRPDIRIRQEVRGHRVLLDLAAGEREAPAAAVSDADRPAPAPRAERPASMAMPEAQTRAVAAPAASLPVAPASPGDASAAAPAASPAPATAPTRDPHPVATGPARDPDPGVIGPDRDAAPAAALPPRDPAMAAAGSPWDLPAPAAAPAVLAAPDAVPVRLVFGAPGQPRAVVLPFGEDTGIALLRRGDTVLVVLDTPRPLTLAALRGDPVFGAMETRVVPGGTVLALRLAEPATLVARRRDGAWSLTAAATAPPAEHATIEAMGTAPGLLIRTPHAARVLALPDPETGLPLLIGTVNRPALTLMHLRRLPEGDLLPSITGLATLARADRFALRATAEGFVVTGALALDPAVAGPEPPRAMTRLFEIPVLPLATLRERLRAENAAVRGAPPLGRASLRRTAAETLLALGMPQEAQSMLAIGAAEDPRLPDDPAIAALAGAAALLAGRLSEAEGLARPDLPERDETLLWRAMFDAARGNAVGAAPRLAATLPLALGYPEALRQRVLGPIAEALAEAGHLGGLRALAAAGPLAGAAQGFAEAALAEAEGRTAAAIAGYAQLAEGRDRQLRARALRRGVELRLAAREIDASKAADALEAALFAWRGDLQEVSTRRRLAALRLEAGEAQAAFSMLRETVTLFPDQAEPLQPALQDAFLETLLREAPLTAVTHYDAEPALLPADARGDAALLGLADRLVALDLPGRAVALLRPAMLRAAPGSARRAELGLRIAQLQTEDGKPEEALAALRESQADALPAELGEARGRLTARAEAQAGRRDAAIATLRTLGPAGAEPLAEMLAEVQDWTGAAQALDQHLAARIPAEATPLEPDEARLVLRQAALLALANDAAGLSALAARFRPRMGQGPVADAFAALTADPMRGIADLPRLQQELRLFRAVPGPAEPLRAASLGTR